jgi:hypothetical protein
MKLESLDPKMRILLSVVPKRNEDVKWEEEEGLVVLIYPKNFTRFEKFLHKRLGGPADIRRPLDDKGTFIWKMCDGNHNVHEICKDTHNKFKEDIEPVVRRVWGFLERLIELNLVLIDKVEDQDSEVEEEKSNIEDEKSKGKEKMSKVEDKKSKGETDETKEE